MRASWGLNPSFLRCIHADPRSLQPWWSPEHPVCLGVIPGSQLSVELQLFCLCGLTVGPVFPGLIRNPCEQYIPLSSIGFLERG